MIMILHRNSPNGLAFTLYKNFNKTNARLGSKVVTLDMDIDSVNAAWYQWQMGGLHIQNAFPNLPAEQREFLISGTTPEEWKKLFGEE